MQPGDTGLDTELPLGSSRGGACRLGREGMQPGDMALQPRCNLGYAAATSATPRSDPARWDPAGWPRPSWWRLTPPSSPAVWDGPTVAWAALQHPG